ncbi:MAE_28990/MAE_18760 family HEPN-like nuclease [Endozoicomonas atrinae]|uniref:MAE_28990/MAE_18760 family HEPN-like nuclease n=1 Tax=Endozoicomonas atrinae TaxID=1333660 RepID=UPI000824C399|nr:MAE_28990/MAE_18760 family HEPN-like nuclease [Endozoicomonas atrinae]
MSLERFQEQIEAEREWREDEIRFLDNIQRSIQKSNDQKRIRRSILCLIYAHIEGFVQFSFSLYIDEINKKNLKCSEVKPVIAAATLHKEFIALNNKDKKSNLFKSTLPDETHLHRLCRQVEFVESISSVQNQVVVIPDGYVNTESNVGQQVLEKLLYQVGLDYKDLKDIYSPLNRLINVRNDISHGKRKQGIDDQEYQQFINCCKSIISAISRRLTTAYGRNEFLVAC